MGFERGFLMSGGCGRPSGACARCQAWTFPDRSDRCICVSGRPFCGCGDDLAVTPCTGACEGQRAGSGPNIFAQSSQRPQRLFECEKCLCVLCVLCAKRIRVSIHFACGASCFSIPPPCQRSCFSLGVGIGIECAALAALSGRGPEPARCALGTPRTPKTCPEWR